MKLLCIAGIIGFSVIYICAQSITVTDRALNVDMGAGKVIDSAISIHPQRLHQQSKLLSIPSAEASYPDAFYLGVQKGGSSFLTKLLARCPGVCIGETKEPHVFSQGAVDPLGFKDRNVSRTSSRRVSRREIYALYRKHFAKCPEHSIRIDATPYNWIKYDEIFSVYNPNELSTKKFIVVLRDPVDREFSWYNHQLRACAGSILKMLRRAHRLDASVNGTKSLFMCNLVMKKVIRDDVLVHLSAANATASKLLKMGVLSSFAQYVSDVRVLRGDGLYLHHIQRWLSALPRTNLLILNFDVSMKNTSRTIEIIADFLSDSRANRGELCRRGDSSATLVSNMQRPPPRVHSSYVTGAELDCKSSRELRLYFETRNQGLYEFINNHLERPKLEPTFPSFKSKYNCV
jgi:hypothetical protein